MQVSKVSGVCHVKRFSRCFVGALIGALQLLAACGNTVCLDNETGDWFFSDGQWLHCKSWVHACGMLRAIDDCKAEARDGGCK